MRHSADSTAVPAHTGVSGHLSWKNQPMRRSVTALLLGLAALLVSSATAHADSVSIGGSGDISKLSLDNRDAKVVVKVFAPSGPIGSVEAVMKDDDGTRYTATIINGTDGDTALYKGGPVDPTDVSCPNLSIGYNDTGDFWRFAVPRGCLDGLAGKIKGKAIYHEEGAASGSETAWTPWVRRG